MKKSLLKPQRKAKNPNAGEKQPAGYCLDFDIFEK
jgi:hypothetical protein